MGRGKYSNLNSKTRIPWYAKKLIIWERPITWKVKIPNKIWLGLTSVGMDYLWVCSSCNFPTNTEKGVDDCPFLFP